MSPVEPGTYRIVNALSGAAITVPNQDTWGIIGSPIHDEPSQQWFVQRSGDGYCFKSCSNGRYITIDSTQWTARAYLGHYPPTWQILPDKQGSYAIQYGDSDRVLDMHAELEPHIGGEIHVWPRQDLPLQRRWKFERLSNDTGNQDEQMRHEIAIREEQITAKNQQLMEKDLVITQQSEQLAQKDQQLISQATQLATQNQLLVEQSRELMDQGRRIVEQSSELVERSDRLAEKDEELAEKDEELARGYRELADKLVWAVQRGDALSQGAGELRLSETVQTVGSSARSEIAALREKVERLERLMAQILIWLSYFKAALTRYHGMGSSNCVALNKESWLKVSVLKCSPELVRLTITIAIDLCKVLVKENGSNLVILRGTYRLVNVLSKKAITVPNDDPWGIIGYPIYNESNHRRSGGGGGYRFKNCSNGHYIPICSTENNARVSLGRFPPTWKILQEEERSYSIQYGDFDRVLDMHTELKPNIGGEIHIWPRHDLKPQKRWKFEWLSNDTGEQNEQVWHEITTKDEQITAKNQLLAEKDRLIARQGEKLVAQSQQLAEQSRELAEQGRRLVEQSRELANRSERLVEKDEEMIRGYKELGDKLVWVAQRENSLRREAERSRPSDIEVQSMSSSTQDSTRREQEQGEVAELRGKVERLERLVDQRLVGPSAQSAYKHSTLEIIGANILFLLIPVSLGTLLTQSERMVLWVQAMALKKGCGCFDMILINSRLFAVQSYNMVHIQPGTYRITNVASGTALAIPDNNVWDVVCWGRNDDKNQQAPLYAAWYPTSWQLIQNQEDHNMYMWVVARKLAVVNPHSGLWATRMKCGDVDLVIDLDDYGAGHNGNHIHAYAQEHWVPQKRWRLERISDETGDEEWRLKQEAIQKNKQLASKDQQLASNAEQLASKDRCIAEKDKLAVELTERLASKDRELARVKQELSEKSALLEQTRRAPRQEVVTLKSRDSDRNLKDRNLEEKLSQQQKETVGLREKMERVERLLSQMMDSGVKRPNNMS
ncbi:hypothetical protein BDV93DRAFT_541431 [Ceratobasidium sp. AG-I]|nr:hypothetical protein BDV93DRAFT_541431 [Ceratobasidium sp. AG-I]